MKINRHRKPDEIDELELRRRELDEQIEELKGMPEQLQLEMIESARTIPPPDDLAERARQSDFERKAARGQIRNERRTQGRSLVLMLLLLTATTAVMFWVVQLANA